MTAPGISRITFGQNASTFGIGQSRPDISFRYTQTRETVSQWLQKQCEIRITREGRSHTYDIETDSNICIPWPRAEPDLKSRERARVEVRAFDGTQWTEWHGETLEVSLLTRSDWGGARIIAPDVVPPARQTKRPFYMRRSFQLSSRQLETLKRNGTALRVYATALGVYRLEINGQPVGDHVLAPGWQSYHHRLHFQTYNVPVDYLQEGENVIGAIVGEGWYAGRLMWTEGVRNCWGERPGVMIRMEMGDVVLAIQTDRAWEWAYGPLLSSELYDGEQFDIALYDKDWSRPSSQGTCTWRPVECLPPLADNIELIAPEAPPIRRIEERAPVKLITTPSGKKVIDFGQNLVGWVKIHKLPPAPELPSSSDDRGIVTMKHSEWLEHGEPNYAILRSAKATDTIFLGSAPYENYEPSFTTHGFQYVEIKGWPGELTMDNFVAVVVMSDMEQLGDFSCSHKLVNRLHENVVWSLKGNSVGVPTDCPQRDERLGYTGDAQVIATTANYLYDTSGFISNWLHDLSTEAAFNEHVPPVVAPQAVKKTPPERFAIWSDVIALGPWELYQSFGSTQILKETYEAMCNWLDKGIVRNDEGLWNDGPAFPQLGDWLDPRAPAYNAALAMTDPHLVANAYLVRTTQVVADIAKILGRQDDAARYSTQHKKLVLAFQRNYITPAGRLVSDSQTAIVLAEEFGLLPPQTVGAAIERLERLVLDNKFRISTGFAGTPAILPSLARQGKLAMAYRMLQEGRCPSWLYPVTCGATTVWERWDSLKPDGSVNNPGMTSFNHYALGAVAHFLHSVTGGILMAAPGYRRVLIRPQPGGTITWAKTHHITPSGRVACHWEINQGKLKVEVEIPPNTSATIQLPGQKDGEEVGSGFYSYVVDWTPDPSWPPQDPPRAIGGAGSSLLLE